MPESRYTIISQRETTAQAQGGELIPVMEIRFSVAPSNTVGSVQVPVHIYVTNVDEVRARILKYVDAVDAVANLSD